MGFWSKLKKAVAVAVAVAPALPIPDKAKRVVATVGDTERKVEEAIRETPTKPTA